MDITLIFKIAGVGMLVAVTVQLLKQTGREDIAMLAALAGITIVFFMVIDVISVLYEELRRTFNLY